MMYYKFEKENDTIFLVEFVYDKSYALKSETVFSQCNGYMGIRGGLFCKAIEQSKGMFLAGFYNKAEGQEVTELVNCPDITAMNVSVDGVEICLDDCNIKFFERRLNLKTGEFIISSTLQTKTGILLSIENKRFVSMDELSFVGQTLSVTLLNAEGTVCITTGIDGQITNSGQSHFTSEKIRVYEKDVMQYCGCIGDEKALSILSVCRSERKEEKRDFIIKRRQIWGVYEYEAKLGQRISFEKYSTVRRGTDTEQAYEVRANYKFGTYANMHSNHMKAYRNQWKYADIKIEGSTLEEEGALAFAVYHLIGMTPFFTNEYGVGAKGLTGEGYKGHVFWDSEIFILPMFQYQFPEVAKKMLEFRCLGIEGARKKAKEYGYEGAMYPWETAIDGEEETPLYAALNIHTGQAEKVWSGIKEHHVSADIAYALWMYYQITKDQAFMEQCGASVLMEISDFWCARAVENEAKTALEIRDIIGPDEYTEHVNNNAYTNYMAKRCVETALQMIKKGICQSDEERMCKYQDFLNRIYLPNPNEAEIIPQDDTFLSKPEIPSIETYRSSKKKQEILLDYSREEVVGMQVLKQADVVMLMNLCPEYFAEKVVMANVDYYEKRTVHDSSLSLCAHAIACCNIKQHALAYEFFQKAMEIDLGDNPNDSQDGIHAASLGGIWNCIMQGFAGLGLYQGVMSLRMQFPTHWKCMQFAICIEGNYLDVAMDRERISVSPQGQLKMPIEICIEGVRYSINKTKKIVHMRDGFKG